MAVIQQIPVLSDNYVTLAHDPETAATAFGEGRHRKDVF